MHVHVHVCVCVHVMCIQCRHEKKEFNYIKGHCGDWLTIKAAQCQSIRNEILQTCTCTCTCMRKLVVQCI